MGLDNDFDIWKVPHERILEEARKIKESSNKNVDGFMLSCSALRVLNDGPIDKLEKLLKVPVVTSMQAFMWDMLRTSSETKQITRMGTLFRISPEVLDFNQEVCDMFGQLYTE
jgi:maleate isomerase